MEIKLIEVENVQLYISTNDNYCLVLDGKEFTFFIYYSVKDGEVKVLRQGKNEIGFGEAERIKDNLKKVTVTPEDIAVIYKSLLASEIKEADKIKLDIESIKETMKLVDLKVSSIKEEVNSLKSFIDLNILTTIKTMLNIEPKWLYEQDGIKVEIYYSEHDYRAPKREHIRIRMEGKSYEYDFHPNYNGFKRINGEKIYSLKELKEGISIIEKALKLFV